MFKRNYLLLIAIVFSLYTCTEKFDGYTIDGTIKGMENQSISLEFLAPDKVEKIDSATTDANGNFQLKGNVAEKGFYRIINGNKFWIILLENKAQKFVADANHPELRDVVIENYPEGEDLQKTLDSLIQTQQEFEAFGKKLQASLSPQSTQEEQMQAQMQFMAFQQSVMQGLKDKIDQKLEANPYSALYLMLSLNPQTDKDFIEEKISIFEEKMPNNPYIKSLKDVLTKMSAQQTPQQQKQPTTAVKVGDQAPDIVMSNPAGKDLKLSDLKGKVVLVDFWASWCRPCRAENPNIVRTYHQYKNKGFDIFSVSLDKKKDAWTTAIAQDGLIWKNHVSDLQFWNNSAAKAWGVSSIPAAFLLDKDGKIIAQNLRGAQLEAKLKEVLK